MIFLSDSTKANETLQELSLISTNRIKIYQCDISDYVLVQNTYNSIKEDFKKSPKILVNSAGIAWNDLFLLESIENHRRSFEINYFGPMHMSKVCLPDMIRAKYGRIINLSSNNVSINNRGSTAYSASKIALEKFSHVLGGEVAKYGITVNTIRPGIINSEMSQNYLNEMSEQKFEELTAPTGLLNESNEIAKTVEFLIKSNNINSTSITVDSGHALFRKV